MKMILNASGLYLDYSKRPSIFRRRINKTSPALKGVEINLFQGECIGLLGHNGAGKSTLLTILSGLMLPSRGNIECQQSRLLVNSRLDLYPELSGKQNVILKGLYFGLSLKEVHKQMEHIVDLSGVHHALEKSLESYSSGMKSRLNFASGLYFGSDILLLDEAFGGGDAPYKRKARAALQSYLDSGKSVIMASHDVKEIRKFCTRVLVLRWGEAIYFGKDIEFAISLYDQ